MGRDLDVDYLLLGTARSRGDSYDFTLQLVRADNGMAVWGEPITVPHVQPLEVEQLIVDRITRALEVPIDGERPRECGAPGHHERGGSPPIRHWQGAHDSARVSRPGAAVVRGGRAPRSGVCTGPRRHRTHAGPQVLGTCRVATIRRAGTERVPKRRPNEPWGWTPISRRRTNRCPASIDTAKRNGTRPSRRAGRRWHSTRLWRSRTTTWRRLSIILVSSSIQIRRASQAFRPTLTAARTHC